MGFLFLFMCVVLPCLFRTHAVESCVGVWRNQGGAFRSTISVVGLGGWVPSDGKGRETDRSKKKQKQGMVDKKTRFTFANRLYVLVLLLAYPQ